MRIAITQRVVETKEYKDDRDALSQEWTTYLQKIFPGCIVMPVPNMLTNVQNWFDSLAPDCLILSNGNDWGTAKDRDHTEISAIGWALEKNIPIVGICRGFQVINNYFGGDVTQILSNETNVPHVAVSHTVNLKHKSFCAIIEHENVVVNSYHNHGVHARDLSPKLDVFAMAPDDIVEGLFHPTLTVLGIQWHPERSGSDEIFDSALLQKFILEGKFW